MANTTQGREPTKAQRAALEDWAENSEGLRGLWLDNVDDVKPIWTAGEEPGAAGKFMPADQKKKVNWRIRPSGASGIGKAWILPNGEPVQLGSMWHHEYFYTPGVQERWGLSTKKILGSTLADDRNGILEAEQDALRRGFARVNYLSNTGTLTVEARAKDWRKLKDSIATLVEKNLDNVDNMRVNLMDETAKKTVDSMQTKLFDFDTDQEKLANLPFISTGEIRGGAQYMPRKLNAPVSGEFADTLEEIREGKLFGATVNAFGDVWKPKNDKVFLVTLVNKNVLQSDLTPTMFYDTLGQYTKLLDNPDVVAGVFAFDKEGKKMVSIDINAVVPEANKKAAVEFAKDNNQISIWDQAKGEEVKTGGTSVPNIKNAEQAQRALDLLRAGKPFNFADVTRPVPEQQALGLTVEENQGPKSYRRKDASLSIDDYAEKYPESIIPKTRDEPIPSQITESPILKGLDSEEAKVRVFADKLVEEAQKWADNPFAKAGAKWYEEITPALKKTFGKLASLFTELLAATSPQTGVPDNFKYSVLALDGFKRGDYQPMIVKYIEGLAGLETGKTQRLYRQDLKAGKVTNPPETPTEATYMAQWIKHYNLLPRQPNGKLFGIHSVPVLQVMARQWLTEARGLKVNQFVKNLLGTNDEAKIDMWADRLMRRLGYSGLVDRWRIKPQNQHSVSDADFRFSQNVFRAAADQLGMKPSALQGMLWFTEKQHWADNGWSLLELESFLKELEKLPNIRAEQVHLKAQQNLKLKVDVEPRTR
jgi:hypothetical protein